jgi:predicted dehydrogenase
MNKVSRRLFTTTAAAVTAASYSRILGANDRIHMGYIGLGNRGDQVHDAFLEHGDNQTVAVCDLREDYMDFAVKKSRATPKKFHDYKSLLEDKNVDAVVIATPDHWHALMFIDACNAGKDVYVEKPLSLTVVEGRKMVEAAERTKRVSQVGTQRRSTAALKEAAEIVRSGGIGQVALVNTFSIDNEWPNGIGNPSDSAPPDPQQWDKWLGPAPMVPYNRNRAFYKFRWFYNYSGGQLTNYGVHNIDMVRWCLGQDYPKRITAMGGKYVIKDNREIPDTMEVIWEYDGGTMVTFTQCNSNASPTNVRRAEIVVRGSKGTMYLMGGKWEIVPEQVTDLEFFARTPVDRESEKAYRTTRKPVIEARSGGVGPESTPAHARNFLDCIKSRQKCNADILIGHISTASVLLGNIAHKTKSVLEWNGTAERFTNSPDANRFLRYDYRPPYKLG